MALSVSSRVRLLSSLLLVLACIGRLAAEPVVVQRTLPNGLRVVVVRDPVAPVVTTDLNYQVGADEETIEGTAHATEHMMFRGSKTLSASQMADIMALTGGRFNAETENERTHFYFTVPARDLDVVLRMEAARAQDLLMTQDLWDSERGAITQESDNQFGDGEYRLYRKARQHVLRDTPYADDGLGTAASFNRMTPADLQAFYRTWYHPNNAVLVVCGDVQPDEVQDKVANIFGTLPSAPLPPRRSVVVAPSAPAAFQDQTDHEHTATFVYYPFPGYVDSDYAASQVLMDVLSSPRAPLADLVATGKALNADFGCETYRQAGLAWVTVAAAMDQSVADVSRMGRTALDEYRHHGVPAALVDVARRERLALLEHRANSIEGLALAWGVAEAQDRTPQQDADATRRVTVDDVNRVLRKYIVDATATTCNAVPHGRGTVARARKAENPTAPPNSHDPLPPWAVSLAEVHPPSIPLAPVDLKLANGLRLIVVPCAVSKTVVLRGEIRHEPGLQADAGKDGVDDVTDDLLSYGTASDPRHQWLAELDRIAASADVEPSVGTSFGCNVLSADFDRAVQLLSRAELHPALCPDDFEVVRQQAWDDAVARRREPHRMAEVVLSKALYPWGDPKLRRPTPDTVANLTLADVKRWHARVFRPDMTTIVVVGDVTPDAARASVQRWFGQWHASGPRPAVVLPPVPDNPALVKVLPDPGRLQDEVRMVETLRLRRTDPEAAALRLANTILTDGFFVSLLFHDLRETTGYVYDVDSWLSVHPTRALFGINFAASPANTQKAADVILQDLRQLQTVPLSAERLQKAKLLRLGELPLAWASYEERAEDLLDLAIDDEPLDGDVQDVLAELTVTPEQLMAASKKWIRPDAFVRVILAARPK